MSWWHYLLLVNFYLVLFFGFYVLLLRRETFFQLNRIYLVAASLLSFLIPVIQADWVKNLFITQQVQSTIYSMPVMAYEITFTPAPDVLTVGEILNALYISVTLFLILRLLWQLVILKKAIEKPEPSAAYSFFKKISLGKDIANRDVIAAHEQVHARQWHSVDVMIIETVMIINWFNPVVYLYRFAIKLIHEFIADRQVVQAGTNKADYALLLLSQTFEVETHKLVIPFYNHSLLKNRIIMLQKNKSQRIALAKYGLSAPLFALMLIFSSATVSNSKAVEVINNHAEKVFDKPAAEAVTAVTDIATTNTDEDPVVTKVDNPPMFPGGMVKFYEYLRNAIKYPAIDQKNNVSGKVYVSFIVEKDGSLSNIKAIRGPSATLQAEGVRVMKASPKWKPGVQKGKPVRVNYTIPMNFALDTKPVNKPAGKVFAAVEVPPSYPGGMEAFYKFVSREVHYPKVDQENNITGKAYTSFIVEVDGSLSNIKTVRGPSATIQAEAVRVIAASPKWTPGIQNGKAVRVSYTIPLNFALEPDDNKADGKVFAAVEVPPSFPGGMEKFYEFVRNTVRYPASDKKDGISGKVYISFIVETDGSLSSVKSVRGPSATLDAEAVRVVSASPKWRPGIQNSRPVRVSYTIPLSFTLDDTESKTPTKVGAISVKGYGLSGSPIYVINGVTKTKADYDQLAQEDITKVEVFKDDNATSLYGSIAKDGAIIVSTRDYKKFKETMANNPSIYYTVREVNLKAPLYIINNVVANESDYKKLKRDQIESIEIVKDAPGKILDINDKSGAIIVTTKSYKKP